LQPAIFTNFLEKLAKFKGYVELKSLKGETEVEGVD
jgi:hypothetical protein